MSIQLVSLAPIKILVRTIKFNLWTFIIFQARQAISLVSCWENWAPKSAKVDDEDKLHKLHNHETIIYSPPFLAFNFYRVKSIFWSAFLSSTSKLCKECSWTDTIVLWRRFKCRNEWSDMKEALARTNWHLKLKKPQRTFLSASSVAYRQLVQCGLQYS